MRGEDTDVPAMCEEEGELTPPCISPFTALSAELRAASSFIEEDREERAAKWRAPGLRPRPAMDRLRLLVLLRRLEPPGERGEGTCTEWRRLFMKGSTKPVPSKRPEPRRCSARSSRADSTRDLPRRESVLKLNSCEVVTLAAFAGSGRKGELKSGMARALNTMDLRSSLTVRSSSSFSRAFSASVRSFSAAAWRSASAASRSAFSSFSLSAALILALLAGSTTFL
mmetsp:Transcript_13762/g.29621  ORF Transcript_13762/g.29621 Transcript_13762/m.29621 type:complete len:226 (+) Transcript_13762:708-1385(+)